MANIQVFFDNEPPEFIVDLNEWHGKQMSNDYVVEAIQHQIRELENDPESDGVSYTLCGDTLVLINREDSSSFPYVVMVSKVKHRGYVKRV
jgi:hypothetical protein